MYSRKDQCLIMLWKSSTGVGKRPLFCTMPLFIGMNMEELSGFLLQHVISPNLKRLKKNSNWPASITVVLLKPVWIPWLLLVLMVELRM